MRFFGEQENRNIVATSKSCSKSDQHGDDWLVVDLKLDFLHKKVVLTLKNILLAQLFMITIEMFPQTSALTIDTRLATMTL